MSEPERSEASEQLAVSEPERREAGEQPAVRVRGVSVRFGDATVLDDVDLGVVRGGWLGLLGPNGAGKTTLLRSLAGLVAMDAGTVTVDGLDVTTATRRAVARRVALVEQRPSLPPGMRALEYVLLGRAPHVSLLGTETTHDVAVARAALERLDAGGFADRDVLTLSGGEAQRVVLARALAQEAPVLLLDEPTTALDLGHQQQVLELVDELRRERGLTVVSTLHDLTVVGQFAADLVLLDRGRVVADGPPAVVLHPDLLAEVYGASVRVVDDGHGRPLVVPVRRGAGPRGQPDGRGHACGP